MGTTVEPNHFNLVLPGFVTPSGGAKAPMGIAQNYLAVDGGAGGYVSQLAELISVENGTWRINADGTMDTTWRLRPNIKWQDATPFTSADLLFTYEVYRDRESGARQGVVGKMQSAAAPDPYTFVVHWSSIDVDAAKTDDLDPLPRHLLDDARRTDIANLDKSPLLTTDFVGLGPYRLVTWERGSHMEFTRFDDYYMGRPPLDRVIVRFISDKNSLIAATLAGAIDVVPARVLGGDDVAGIERQWEGTGNRVHDYIEVEALNLLLIQHRPEYAQPLQGLTNVIVRRALFHAFDRKTLAEALNAVPADSWYAPNHELRPQLEADIPQFPYDVRRAQQLLSEAGWVRESNNVLAHSLTGDRFVTQISFQQSREYEPTAFVLADHWKAIGVQADLSPVPPALVQDRELFATMPGVRPHSGRLRILESNYHHSSEVPSAANRWTGANRGGYKNPRVDALLDRLEVTVNRAERLPLQKELLREQLGDLANMPLYWPRRFFLAVAGVRGITDGDTWRMFQWNQD